LHVTDVTTSNIRFDLKLWIFFFVKLFPLCIKQVTGKALTVTTP